MKYEVFFACSRDSSPVDKLGLGGDDDQGLGIYSAILHGIASVLHVVGMLLVLDDRHRYNLIARQLLQLRIGHHLTIDNVDFLFGLVGLWFGIAIVDYNNFVPHRNHFGKGSLHLLLHRLGIALVGGGEDDVDVVHLIRGVTGDGLADELRTVELPDYLTIDDVMARFDLLGLKAGYG